MILIGKNLPEFLDDFVQKSISRISADDLTSDEYSFLNYLYSEGLVPLGNQKLIDEILSQAKKRMIQNSARAVCFGDG